MPARAGGGGEMIKRLSLAIVGTTVPVSGVRLIP